MRNQDSFETLQRIALVLMAVGILSLGMSYAWRPLGWEQPSWSEEEQDQFAKAAHDYNKLGHRIDPPENDSEFVEKLRTAKAEYDKQHELLMNARSRGEWTVRALFFGGILLIGLGLIGTMAAKNGE